MNKLPPGDEIHRLRTEQNLSLSAIAERYEATRQAAHKRHKRWAEKNGVEWRVRSTATATNPSE